MSEGREAAIIEQMARAAFESGGTRLETWDEAVARNSEVCETYRREQRAALDVLSAPTKQKCDDCNGKGVVTGGVIFGGQTHGMMTGPCRACTDGFVPGPSLLDTLVKEQG